MGFRRFLWALWLLAAALLWFFENNAATLALLAASVLLPLLSVLDARRRGKRVRLTLSVPQAAEKGGVLSLGLSAEGVGRFSRAAGRVRLNNGLTRETAELPFAFSPSLRGKAAVTLTAEALRCGVLCIETAARTEDLFGLWRSKPLPCGKELVTVAPRLFLPRVTLTENTTVVTEGELYSQTKPGSDPSETFGVREYLPGDPIRQIHWKLSQKADTLLLRELGLPVVNRTLLVFRNVLTEREDVTPAQAEAMAEVFLSVSRALVNDGLAHTAAFAAHGQYLLTEVQNETELHALEARLLALSWEADDGALSRLLGETPYAHVAVLSAAVPPDAERYCRGNRVTLLTLSPGAGESGVFTVPFTAEGFAEELQFIEL